MFVATSSSVARIVTLTATLAFGALSTGCSGSYDESQDANGYTGNVGETNHALTLGSVGSSLGSLPGASTLQQTLDTAVTELTGVTDGGVLDPSSLTLPDPSSIASGAGLTLPTLPSGSVSGSLSGSSTGTVTGSLTGSLTLPGSNLLSNLSGTSLTGSLPTVGSTTTTSTGSLPLPNLPLIGTGGGSASLQCGLSLVTCNGSTCVDLTSDPANCGACGNACASGSVCQNGACAKSCLPLFTACAGSCVSTATDTANCGACGNACTTGQVCLNGNCLL